jgi:hypothetical protein
VLPVQGCSEKITFNRTDRGAGVGVGALVDRIVMCRGPAGGGLRLALYELPAACDELLISRAHSPDSELVSCACRGCGKVTSDVSPGRARFCSVITDCPGGGTML